MIRIHGFDLELLGLEKRVALGILGFMPSLHSTTWINMDKNISKPYPSISKQLSKPLYDMCHRKARGSLAAVHYTSIV